MRLQFVLFGALLSLALPATALGAGADVSRDSGSAVAAFDSPNICGWPASFNQTGGWHYTVVSTQGHQHVNYNEAVNWTLVLADDPSVPVSLRGVTWRGRNELTFVLNLDPSTERVVNVILNPNSEGPFHGLLERIVFVAGADGTVRVDRHEFVGAVDCSAFV